MPKNPRLPITTMAMNPWPILACMVFAVMMICAAEPPEAVKPTPSAQQMAWQRHELLMFAHFGIKTYFPSTNHMGSGKEDPAKFDPEKLDARQWVEAAKAGGFKGIILTAKHHDGFCLWPTETTDFSVKSTPWKDGKGDVIREFADACRKAGVWFGIYLSAYDVHYEKSSSDKAAYAKYFEKQLTELCSNYGPIDELWFDGFGSKNMKIDNAAKSEIIRKLQPNAIIFGAVEGLEHLRVKWPRNEQGIVADPNWNVYPAPDKKLDVSGDAVWYPSEADTIAQGNWFWNAEPICSLDRLKEIHHTSVGRGGVALINVPPNPQGLIDEASIARLKEFRAWVEGIQARDVALQKKATASAVRGQDPAFGPDKAVDGNDETYWTTDDGVTTGSIEVDLGQPVDIEGFIVQEYVPLGQRIAKHHIEFWDGGEWRNAVSSTTIGYKRIHWKNIKAGRVRLVVTSSRACPLVNAFQVIRSAAP